MLFKKPAAFLLCLLVCCCAAFAQRAIISGRVVNQSAQPIGGVSVVVLGQASGIATNDSGRFSLSVRANRALALEFSYAGYQRQQKNFYLSNGEEEVVVITLVEGDSSTLQTVTVTNRSDRQQAGLVTLNPRLALNSPSPITGVENLIKVIVGSNNELSSQYNVRGGSFDENLVYVNDFEIYRPYLIRNGQQEGLSFINPALVRNLRFYNGAFPARFGDKLSSVLDVQYRNPTAFHGSAYAGLLEQGVHAEGSGKKGFTYLVGLRNRSLRNLLSNQETKGNYLPSSSDVQMQLTYKAGVKWLFEMLGNLSGTRFDLEPVESQQTTSVFTPLFSANLGLDINYSGNERDGYKTRMLGTTATLLANKSLRVKGMLSYFENKEQENINIAGDYLFGERDFDKSSSQFGLIVNPLGAGSFLRYARNELNVKTWHAGIRADLKKEKHQWQFGSMIDLVNIDDLLNEFEMRDSAGYSLPYQPGPLLAVSTLQSTASLQFARISGYIQDNFLVGKNAGITMQGGLRYNYSTLNNELLISPRVGMSFTPQNWKRDVIFRFAGGLYQQPPFYRELRRYDGSVNKELKAQKSMQVSGGADYAFSSNGRPFRFTAEAYYKSMWDVVPYDIDNVRLRYFGDNSAKAYAWGLEGRLFGELVRDAESWVSVGFGKTAEDLSNDFYYNYFNADGELIGAATEDKVVADSTKVNLGWLRRPTDRRVNVGIFFSDYLTTNKNFRVYVQTLFGTNLPYNIPGSVRYRNALEIPPYLRVDLGFTYQLVGGTNYVRRSRDPFRKLNDMWLSLEVFNLLDRDNIISYSFVNDFANNSFAVPNRLTPRLLNLKLSCSW